MYVTTAEAKTFLRVEVDDDDTLIESLITAAEEVVALFLNAPLSDFATGDSGDSPSTSVVTLPESIKTEIKIHVGDMYENREKQLAAPLSLNLQSEQRLHFWRRSLGV